MSVRLRSPHVKAPARRRRLGTAKHLVGRVLDAGRLDETPVERDLQLARLGLSGPIDGKPPFVPVAALLLRLVGQRMVVVDLRVDLPQVERNGLRKIALQTFGVACAGGQIAKSIRSLDREVSPHTSIPGLAMTIRWASLDTVSANRISICPPPECQNTA